MRSVHILPILAALLSAPALGRISVTVPEGSGTITEQVQVGGKWRIQFTSSATASPTTLLIRATASGEKIEYVRVLNGSSTGQTCLVRIEPNTGTFDTVDEVSRVNSNTRFLVVQTLTTTGDVGIISCTNLSDSDIGGDCTGPVTALDAGGGGSAITELTVHGDLLGDVSAQYGEIVKIDVDGAIGTSGNPVDIWARDAIQQVLADGSIYADIDANQYNSTGDIGRIFSGGVLISGTIDADRFTTYAGVTEPGVFTTTGNLGANITLLSAMDRTIRIGGSFNSGKTIALPTNGLTGQIIFNDDNNSSTWSGDITINGSALGSQPYYTNTASSIGGGSAGLVSYNLHGSSCVPVDGETVATVYPDSCPGSSLLCDPEAPNNVANARKWATMRMYGPVVFNLSSGQKPCTIERRVIGGSTWTDVTSDYRFDIYTSSDGDGTPDAGERVVRIRRENTSCLKYFPVGYDYRVKPVTGRMKCKGVDGGNSVNVYAFEYNFTLPYDCEESLLGRFDQNGDDDLTSLDMAYLAVTQRDLNDDSAFNALDFDLMGRALAEFPN